jgi:hypothetical protein
VPRRFFRQLPHQKVKRQIPSGGYRRGLAQPTFFCALRPVTSRDKERKVRGIERKNRK